MTGGEHGPDPVEVTTGPPAPAIYFLSDYGTADEFVGVVHAVLHRHAPGLAVIDLSHQIAPSMWPPAPPCWLGALRTSVRAWCWGWSIPGWAPPDGRWPSG